MSVTLERNTVNTVVISLTANGKPMMLNPTDQLKFILMTFGGALVSGSETIIDLMAPGTVLSKGQVVATIDLDNGAYADQVNAIGKCIICVPTIYGRQMTQADLVDPYQLTRSQLFIKELIVPEIRRDQLMAASAGALGSLKVSDDYIWSKLIAAEAEISRRLRVFLTPTRIFQHEPEQHEIDALGNMPWTVDTPQDYEPTMFDRDKWGYFITRHHPIVSVERLRFIMPSAGGQYFDIPAEWMKIDRKYGHVEILPVTNATLITTSVLGFTALTWQSRIPQMVHLEYVSGLVDAETKYPDLLDAVKKMAVTKIITDTFLPQSGSISADGLSESMSVDISKYNDLIDRIIDGPEKSGNGGLQAAIHGIRAMIF
ncbi:tail fiber protein [Yersinia phage fHe-Yen8-01]|nr:tail fiber protein [Yersinia phage fHe-Yen8-01]